MSKYYTPSIEEFHVGFEYEVKIFNEWVKQVWGFNKYHTSEGRTRASLEAEVIRVKYLDKKDIESLGINVQVLDMGEDTEENELDLSTDEGSFGILHLDEQLHNANLQLLDHVFFTVKNKSEFKRLMKQLNIRF